MQRRNRSTYRAAPSSSPARRECTKPTENVTDRSMGMNRSPLGLGFKKSLSESENVTARPPCTYSSMSGMFEACMMTFWKGCAANISARMASRMGSL